MNTKAALIVMFLRRVDTVVHHDIPETLGVDIATIKKDFAPYRKDKLNYSVHEIKKVDEGNYVAPGLVTLAQLSALFDDEEKAEAYLDMTEEMIKEHSC